MRYGIYYYEGEGVLSKNKVGNLFRRYGKGVVVPYIGGEVSFLYLREGLDAREVLNMGFVFTKSYEAEEKVKRFMRSLDFEFAVGEEVRVKGFGKLKFTVKRIEGDKVAVSPHLRFMNAELVFKKSSILDVGGALGYSIGYEGNGEWFGIDGDYLFKVNSQTINMKEFFIFILRLKLEFRGYRLVFFSEEENEIIRGFADNFNLEYVVGQIPVCQLYFTEKDYLVNYSENVVHYKDNCLVVYRSKKEVNEVLRYVVKQMMYEGVITDMVSETARVYVEKGETDKIYKSFNRYRDEIDRRVEEVRDMELLFVCEEREPVSVEQFLKYVRNLGLSWVFDSPDFFHTAIYK